MYINYNIYDMIMTKKPLILLMVVLMTVAMRQECLARKSQSPITIGCIVSGTGDVDATFKNMHDMGFTSCQIGFPSNYTQETIDKLCAAREKYGIKITTVITIPGRCVWNFTEGPSTIGLAPMEGREQKLAEYRRCIDFCQKAGIPAMHSHFGFIPEDPGTEQYKTFIVAMKGLALYAKERGVDIYFETGQETPTTLLRAIKDIGTGNCFINCDTANLLLYGKANPTDAVRQFGNLVRDMHAKDGTYPSADDPYHLGREKPIPEGDVDFPAIIRLLKQQGYTGAITIEYEMSDKTSEYMVKTRKYLQKLIDKY